MPGKKDSLEEYRKKRNFRRTPEPSGTGRGRTKERRFVIQKHDATGLHYDVRLEVDGLLKSWAVPKGPSLDPREKRLAMPTEDHPLSYLEFEGVIPQGEYGAGPVIVWDAGTYRPIGDEPMPKQIDTGHVRVWLDGRKLEGGFALTRISRGKRPRWILVKMDDEGADRRRRPVSSQPESVLTGRTIEDLLKRGA